MVDLRVAPIGRAMDAVENFYGCAGIVRFTTGIRSRSMGGLWTLTSK